MARFSPGNIFSELRRRRLFNTVALYIVGAWVTLQVADLAFPGMDIPDSAIRYVWIGAFALFPLVLVFGWRYDISAGGIKRTPPADAPDDADTSLHRLDHGIIAVLSSLALVVIAGMGVRISQVEPGPQMTTVENSIAVLPFDVCEEQVRDRTLASGLAVEVINRLSERGRLRVFARTSTFNLAGFGLSVAEISKSLGAQYVLTGQLCRAEGGELALAAELFDADGFIVWSERFDQMVNPWDQVTEQLASLVAGGVSAELGDVMPSAPDEPVNKLAYEYKVIGWEFMVRGEAEQAREAFKSALQHEPEYAEAKFGLALLELGAFGDPDEGSRIAKAQPIVESALQLAERELTRNDRDANAHYVAARITRVLAIFDEELLWRQAAEMDDEEIATRKTEIKEAYAKSEQHFVSAIALNPSLTQAYVWLAETVEQQGVDRRSEALEVLEQGQDRDPFHGSINYRIAKRWAARGRFRQAIELLDRFKNLPETPPRAWWWQLELMTLQVYWDEKGETLIDMLLNDPRAFDDTGNRWQAWWFASQLAHLELFEEAEAWYSRIESLPMNEYLYGLGRNQYESAMGGHDKVLDEKVQQLENMSDAEVLDAYSGSAGSAASALAERGDLERAIRLMESIQHAPAIWSERSVNSTLQLAELYLDAGREGDATPLLEQVQTHLEAEYADGIRHPDTLWLLADVYVRQGRDDDALDMLRKSVDYHQRAGCEDETNYGARWDHLRDDPRFIDLCQRMETDMDQQTQRLRAMLARYDMDELLAPLMALKQEASEMR